MKRHFLLDTFLNSFKLGNMNQMPFKSGWSKKSQPKKAKKNLAFFGKKSRLFLAFFDFSGFFSNFKVFLEFLIFLLTPNRYLSQKTNLCTLFKQVELNMWIYLSSFDDVSLPTCQSYTLILLYTFLSFMTKQQ